MSPHSVTIALVDDHDAIRDSLAMLLKLAGYHVVPFRSGEDFIAATGGVDFDCILLDIELGSCTGFDVAAHPAVRQLGVPTVFMTGSSDPLFAVRAAEAGCVAFLRKPFLADTLTDTLTRVLKPASFARM